MTDNKRQHGQYFTKTNPFHHDTFKTWATNANLLTEVILEPFAGENSIIELLHEAGYMVIVCDGGHYTDDVISEINAHGGKHFIALRNEDLDHYLNNPY